MASQTAKALRHIEGGSKALSLVLGGLVMVLVIAAFATTKDLSAIIAWTKGVFGWAFLAMCSGLVFTAIYAWIKLREHPGSKIWLEAGLQAANGVTTLALTYTLLGISLGVGTLADHALTPENVPTVVSELTADFSLAFMTTVVGLPLSAVLRTLLAVTAASQDQGAYGEGASR